MVLIADLEIASPAYFNPLYGRQFLPAFFDLNCP
jgi:hypothetical protein